MYLFFLLKMDKNQLVSMIICAIENVFSIENPLYTLITIDKCYYGCHDDIKDIGSDVLNKLNIDYTNPNFDKMISHDYFVFEYKNRYIIINYICDIWDMAKYQLLVVKTRRDALIYRYGE